MSAWDNPRHRGFPPRGRQDGRVRPAGMSAASSAWVR